MLRAVKWSKACKAGQVMQCNADAMQNAKCADSYHGGRNDDENDNVDNDVDDKDGADA